MQLLTIKRNLKFLYLFSTANPGPELQGSDFRTIQLTRGTSESISLADIFTHSLDYPLTYSLARSNQLDGSGACDIETNAIIFFDVLFPFSLKFLD